LCSDTQPAGVTSLGGRAGPALIVASRQQLGTAAFSAALTTLTRVVRVASYALHRLLFFKAGSIMVHGIRQWFLRPITNMSSFAPAYAGITGSGFVESAQQVQRIFRRNLIHRVDMGKCDVVMTMD
jgi:hypothetical protein